MASRVHGMWLGRTSGKHDNEDSTKRVSTYEDTLEAFHVLFCIADSGCRTRAKTRRSPARNHCGSRRITRSNRRYWLSAATCSGGTTQSVARVESVPGRDCAQSPRRSCLRSQGASCSRGRCCAAEVKQLHFSFVTSESAAPFLLPSLWGVRDPRPRRFDRAAQPSSSSSNPIHP
jgi:hypothetical protein